MNFWRELRRRKIIRVAIVYAITSWLLVQIASIAFPAFEMPLWTLRGFITLLALGLPIALVLTWGFEMTPGGVHRIRPEAEGGPQPTAPGRSRLDYAIIGLVDKVHECFFGGSLSNNLAFALVSC